ncbi:apical endosomal glycoprotein [Crotalus tigris]|uniref:apical endosomal glycoprotein n=1 Tax=Crotalus tigris TaxID=88082 RepID=UPI00192F6133|nr:apical endosomal glycoprotein [Crotalus tigris]
MRGSWGLLSFLLLLMLMELIYTEYSDLYFLHSAGPPFCVQAVFVNRCGSPRVCDFVCDCWDCSDENQCGYQKASALGAPFTCTFEGTMCGWEDISNTAYRWDPAQASISTGLQLPFDHTLGTDLGWYMAATKQRTKPSGPARLRSPLLQGAAAACEIRAWYHLWGSGLNETQQPLLTLELRQGNRTVRLWQSPPGGTYSWQELVAYTGHIPGSFQVTFSAVQGSSSTAQLALDDVEFRNCGFPRPQTCGPEAFHCQQGGCIAKDRVCDGTADCRAGEDEATADCASFTACSFEGDWCQWTVVPNATLPWLRNSSLHLASPSVWPLRDHSTNSREGFFAYVETQKPDLHEGRAWLSSPVLAPDTPQPCYLVLYLHLHGSSSNSLNVYSQTAEALRLVWSRTGDLGSYWFREKVDFTEAKKFKIIIEGRIGSGHEGSIALDDLRLSPHCRAVQDAQLPTPPVLQPSSPCPGGQFACDQGKRCLDFQLLCNFKAECEDASDEQQCGMTDFAKDSGGWMDISVGRLRWTASRLGPVGPVFGLQEGPGQMFSMARAATPVLGPSGLGCVLQMDFTTGPEGLLALAVADESLGTHWWAWSARSNGTASWAEAMVPLGARRRPFQLELLATKRLDGPRGPLPLAVSNISFVNCSAEAPASAPQAGLSCNFETDWCGWYLEQNDGFEWRLSRSRGGAVDHTTGTGSFLFVDPGGPWNPGWRARLVSAPQAAAATVVETSCLSFWYRMDGPQIGTLALKVKEAGESGEQVLWTRTGSHGAVWHRAVSSISPKPGQKYQVILEALRDGFLGSIAVDDITVTSGACLAQHHCSFEVDECGFSVPKQQAWQRQNGTGGWGPPVDHTVGEPRGHYMILCTGTDKLPSGQVTVLRSRTFPPLLRTHCVSFWYYLSGSDPGSLTAYVVEEEKEQETEMGMFSLDQTQGAAWRYGSFVAKVHGRWQVAFAVGGAGGGLASYIALDDIFVRGGGCSEPGSCDFESGPCGWSKPPGNWYSWDWKAAATTLRSPSPQEDHTLGTNAGHYAYVDLAVLSLGKSTARLASEPLAPTTGSCLQFHYHMDFLGHSSSAELRVRLTGAQGERVIWTATGHQSWTWMNQTLLVTSLVEFQIVLEASSGAWVSSGVIALDDLRYTAGPDCASPQAEQAEESSSSSPLPVSTIGVVAGVVSTVLLLLLAATCCLWKRRGSRERMEEEHGNGQGFDNIAFRDDRIILPRMTPNPAAS